MGYKIQQKPKLILQTVTHLGPGGVQSLVIPLSEALSESGYKSILLSYNPITNEFQQNIYNRLSKNGVTVILPSKRLKNPFFRLLYTFRSIKTTKPNLIHIHTPIPNIYICITALILGVKQILTFHTQTLCLNPREHFWGKLKLKITRHYISKFIAISQTVKKSMIENYSLKSSKIEIIYNGINIEKFNKLGINKALKIKITKEPNSFVITHIATIDFKIKKQDKIVELCNKIVEKIPTAKILFIGEGKDFNHLKRITTEKENILVLGNRGDIKDILSITDVVILPSSKEGLPIVLLEAMASGTPIVATTVGSIPEVIDDLQSGLLFNYNDFDQIINKLVLLYNNKELRESISSNARNSVNKFSFNNFLNNHIKLYNEIGK